MPHPEPRQGGELVNFKGVERRYRLKQLHVRRRRRKNIPLADRQSLVRPEAASEVWSTDFVFDRVASGRTIKCPVFVDNAAHKAVAIELQHTLGGNRLTRIRDGICSQRSTSTVTPTDSGPEFIG